MILNLSKKSINNAALILSALLLYGCASNEVTGVCKSCKPYYVRGSWHYPQKHYDYDEDGLASWYGPRFHGKPKPHGELYNQYEMTAAHKTLPIPTIALVTNLKTGKSVRVLVDDRGPYVYEGRIIDLSVAAAKELGCYNVGTARVNVKALPEESDRFARHLARFKNAKDPTGRRWIQVYQQDLARSSGELRSTHYVQQTAPVFEPKLVANTERPEPKSQSLVLHKPNVKKPEIISTEAKVHYIGGKMSHHKHETKAHKISTKSYKKPARLSASKYGKTKSSAVSKKKGKHP